MVANVSKRGLGHGLLFLFELFACFRRTHDCKHILEWRAAIIAKARAE
jgi:hypothetical protein